VLRSLKKIRLLANLLSNSSSRNSLVDEMTSERLPFPFRFHVKAIENSFCHDYPPVYQLCVKVATTVIHIVIRVTPMIPPTTLEIVGKGLFSLSLIINSFKENTI
jgi:hypothetical protein